MLLHCSGCDFEITPDTLLPFACPNQGQGDIDHVLQIEGLSKTLQKEWPSLDKAMSDNPFLRYRTLSYSYHGALRGGMSDDQYCKLVTQLSMAIEAVDNQTLETTPLRWSNRLNLSIKNETINISGSHKARHLIGTAIHLLVARALQKDTGPQPQLAIASCGNAALAAAVVAKAANMPLQVFVPPTADTNVQNRLLSLGASIVECERRQEDPPGDPCYLRFKEAVRDGALPFSCQGGDNALALIGGHTLGWELIEQSRSRPFDYLCVQVGGGALASSVMQAFVMARDANLISKLPRFYAVQTENAHPLARAWELLENSGVSLDKARKQRSQYMWPWESEPRSIASGILDDETYDWFSIVHGLRASGGSVVTVSEVQLKEAQQQGCAHTEILVDHTGSSGLAGLLKLRAQELIDKDEHGAVLFTGIIR